MTQSALDAYAMEQGFGKTTAEMNEQEKAALRYQYVLDSLNDAVGDYSRTSDSWANQTKLLSQQWDQLKTSIGAILIEVLNPLVSVLNTLVLPVLNLFADGLEWVAQHANILGDVITGTMGLLEDLFTPPEEEIQKRMTDSIDTVRSEVEDLGDAYMDTAGKAAESAEIQIGLFDEISLSSDKTRDDIIKNWKTQATAAQNYGDNLKKLMENDVYPAIIAAAADGTVEGMQVIQAMAEDIDETTAQALNDAFDLRQKAIAETNAEVAEVMNALKHKVKETTDEIEDDFGNMTDTIGDNTRDIQKFIDSLHGTTIDIIFNYQTFGTIPSFASSDYTYTPSSYPGNYSLPTAVPYLAEGAVIPPNAPFMAVLGDQRNGTNIEAPADLIRQIVREEMDSSELGGDIHISFGGDLAGLASVLAPVITREQRRNSRAGGY